MNWRKRRRWECTEFGMWNSECGMRNQSALLASTSMIKSKNDQLRPRTHAFALRIIRLEDSLPRSRSANHIGHQVLRSGTSVGANYRAACRARSAAEFRAKLGIVEEEADETAFWLTVLADS